MKYITILYNVIKDGEPVHDGAFSIEHHDKLADAVKYLVKHGARYDEQLIVTEVNWMPGEGQVAAPIDNPPSAPVFTNTPTTEISGPPAHANAGNSNDPDMQPKELDFTKPGGPSGPNRPLSISERMNGGKKKSIFEGLVHPALIPQITADD